MTATRSYEAGNRPPTTDTSQADSALDELLDETVRLGRRLTGAPIVWCALLRGDILEMRRHIGLRHNDLAAEWRLEVGEGIGGKVVATGVPALVYDYTKHHDRLIEPADNASARRRMHVREGLKCSMLVPLRSAEFGVFGLIVFASRKAGVFGNEDLMAAREMCAVSSTAISATLRPEMLGRDHHDATELGRKTLSAIVDCVVGRDDIVGGIDLLGSLLGSSVRLLDGRGETVAHHGSEIESVALALAVPDGTDTPGLLEFTEDISGVPGLSTQLLETIVSVLGAALVRERRNLERNLAERSRAFERFLNEPSSRRERIHQAALLGLDPEGPLEIWALGPDPRRTSELSDLVAVADRATREGSNTCPRLLIVARGDVLIAVASGGGDFSPAATWLMRHWTELNCGRSDAFDIAHLPGAIDDACFALEVAHVAGSGEVVAFDDLSSRNFLVNCFRPRAVRSITMDVLGPIFNEGERGIDYLRTLHTYFLNNRRLDKTAEALHLHVNSLRYRMTRIEELTGRSLRDSDDLFLLEAAARLASSAKGDLHREHPEL